MTTSKTNTIELKEGDVVTFTNSVGAFVTITVTKVNGKSWYHGKSRKSYGTLQGWMKYNDFKITGK